MAFRPRARRDSYALGWWRVLLQGAGTRPKGQDVSKPDAPLDYSGEARQLHDLRDGACPRV